MADDEPIPPVRSPRSPASSRRRGPVWAVWGVLQLLIAILAALLLNAALTLVPEEPLEFEKRMAWLKENPGKYDIIFIGSSRFRYGLPVDTFDAELRKQGVDLGPSFNMGIEGAFMHQNFYTIRRLLDAGVRPRYLAVETSPFTSHVQGGRLRRVETWHDWPESLRVLETTIREKDPHIPFRDPNIEDWVYSRPVRFWTHLRYAFRRNLNVGRFHDFHPGPILTDADRAEIAASRGYKPFETERSTDEPWGTMYFDYPDLWRQRLARLSAGYDGAYQPPINPPAVRELIDYAREKGVRLVFIGTPYSEIEWVEPYLWLAQVGAVSPHCRPGGPPPFLNFNLPQLPYVRDLSLRFDAAHTNNRGSELFARDLARAWARCFP